MRTISLFILLLYSALFASPTNLFKSASRKGPVAEALRGSWSLLDKRPPLSQDTLNIRVVAFRVEFNNGEPDTSFVTTGNGLFGINRIRSGTDQDTKEKQWYNSDTVYTYDNLPHDSIYFADQFRFVQNYFQRVSRGKLNVEATIYPRGSEQAYTVEHPMPTYSPGSKKREESNDDFLLRKSHGLLHFVKDAIGAIDNQNDQPDFSEFSVDSDGNFRDADNTLTFFMLIHAGSSFLSDVYLDTPSDMIDAFISQDFFSFFSDTIGFDTQSGKHGVLVDGLEDQMLIDEIMLAPETSNQDSTNWGIHGVMINQIARALGIPDLYNSSSGITAIGNFGIMDFAGYSAGSGFIPPYPSAWVRALMGWDTPVAATMGVSNSFEISAVGKNNDGSDTTILMVPLNDHEYYLIENRQRFFGTDTAAIATDTADDGRRFFKNFPDNIILSEAASEISETPSRVILDAHHYDVSLPASGVLVWHIDEWAIQQRIGQNLVNADSLYRGVNLVEADGIADLGIQFTDIFFQPAFDYGSAQDVFPYYNVDSGSEASVKLISPYSRPSSTANDGGNTFLHVEINPANNSDNSFLPYPVRDYFVQNFEQDRFSVSLSWDYHAAGWPQRVAIDSADSIISVVHSDVSDGHAGQELVAISAKGFLSAFATAGATSPSLGTKIKPALHHADSPFFSDTTRYLDQIDSPVHFLSVLDGAVAIPQKNQILLLTEIAPDQSPSYDTIPLLPADTLSTWVCGISDSDWVAGTQSGSLVHGVNRTIEQHLSLSDKAVSALAAYGSEQVIAINSQGTAYRIDLNLGSVVDSVHLHEALAPFFISVVDFDKHPDSTYEIIITDRKQGIWALSSSMNFLPGWDSTANDIASYYLNTEQFEDSKAGRLPEDRNLLVDNASAPSFVDLSGDSRPELIIGGTNGIYAVNYKGAPPAGWPYFLSNKFWEQRGSIRQFPLVVANEDQSPLILYSSSSGLHSTYYATKITRADSARGVVFFMDEANQPDSLFGFTASQIDTIVRINDSLLFPYSTPGALIDVVNAQASRPYDSIVQLPRTGGLLKSYWPLSIGSAVSTAPLAGDFDDNDTLDIYSVTRHGWIYRFTNPALRYLDNSPATATLGFSQSRSFMLSKTVSLAGEPTFTKLIELSSYPNPTRGAEFITFRYQFGGAAQKIRLDIFTYTGMKVHTWIQPAELNGSSYPGVNEYTMSTNDLGTGVYRCRLEATVDGAKKVTWWKLALTR